jgi:hypothetical protein
LSQRHACRRKLNFQWHTGHKQLLQWHTNILGRLGIFPEGWVFIWPHLDRTHQVFGILVKLWINLVTFTLGLSSHQCY